MITIDFKELSSVEKSGRGLEVPTRELGEKLNFGVDWNGVGPDGGKDHIFYETISGGLTGTKVRKWLVQCKDFSQSGKTVIGLGEDYNIETNLQEHSCEGFLLVCTTEIGGKLKKTLDSMSAKGTYSTLVWDSHKLTSLIIEPNNEFLFRKFFPNSYKTYFDSLPESVKTFKQHTEELFGLKNVTPVEHDNHNNWRVIEDDHEGYYIDYSFPKISLPGSNSAANEINLYIRAKMLNYKYDLYRGRPLTRFLDFGYEPLDPETIQARNQLWGNDDEGDPKQTISIFCEVVSVTPNFVSIIVYLWQYAKGNAYPNAHSDVINFSVQPVCPLELCDVVNLDALPLIARLCGTGIMKRKADFAMWTTEVGQDTSDGPYLITDSDSMVEPDHHCAARLQPILPNFSRFCLLDDGIMFLFDPGEVEVRAAGTFQVVIPYSSLSQYLQPQVNQSLAS